MALDDSKSTCCRNIEHPRETFPVPIEVGIKPEEHGAEREGNPHCEIAHQHFKLENKGNYNVCRLFFSLIAFSRKLHTLKIHYTRIKITVLDQERRRPAYIYVHTRADTGGGV